MRRYVSFSAFRKSFTQQVVSGYTFTIYVLRKSHGPLNGRLIVSRTMRPSSSMYAVSFDIITTSSGFTSMSVLRLRSSGLSRLRRRAAAV